MATNTQQKQQDPLQKSAPAIAQPLQSSANKSLAPSGTNTAQNQIKQALQQIAPPQSNNSSNNQPKGGNNPTSAVQNNSNNAQKNNSTPNGGNKPQPTPIPAANNGGNNNSSNQSKGGNNNPTPVGQNNSNNAQKNNPAPNGGGNNPAPSNNNQSKGGNNNPTPVGQNNSNNAQKNNPTPNGGNKPQSSPIPVANNGGNNNSPNQPKGGNNQGSSPTPATATASANGVKATSTGNNTTTVTNGNAQVKTQTTTNANGSTATATASVKAQAPASSNGNAAPTAQAKSAAVKAAPGKGSDAPQDLANIGTTINDFFNQTIGGVNPLNQQTLVNDAASASQQITQEIKDGGFGSPTSTAAIHAATIAGNFTQSIGAINGTANAQPQKQLGDITRDINDIIQGDPTLMKGLNTTALPNAANPATPFQDNATQTSFLNNYNNSVTTIANTAVAAAKTGMPNSTQSKAAIQAVQNLINTSDQFTANQGGIYSARFNNELAANGTNGAAGNALITAIQNGDATGAMNAVAVLQGNTGDLGANMTPTTGGMFAFAANA